MDDSKLAEVDFKNESEIQALPSQFCLTSSFFSGSNAELKCESFQFAFDYIEEHGLTIVGDPASRIVTMAGTVNSFAQIQPTVSMTAP